MKKLSIASAILVLLIRVSGGPSQSVSAAGAVPVGDGTIGPTQSSLGNNQMTLLRVQVPSSGTITKLSVYTARLFGSPVLTGVVYADDNGVVGGLLGNTSEVAVTLSSPTWLDLPGLNISASAGYVWIGLMVGPSTNSHAAAFWLHMSAPPYKLDSNISVTYPGVPAIATGYTSWSNVSWSITGTLVTGTTTPLGVSVTPTSANIQAGSSSGSGVMVSTAVGLPTFDASDVDSRGNVFAGFNYGVYKSSDRGSTFSLIFTVPAQSNPNSFGNQLGHAWTVYVDSRDYIFVSIISTNRLYRSTNGGSSFQEVLNLNRPTNDGSIINMGEDELGNLYAAEYGDSQVGARLFKSTSGGASGSWVSLRNFAARHLHNVKMNPYNNWLYLATGESGNNANGLGSADARQIFRSRDHGATWTRIVQGTTASGFVAMSFYNSYVVLGEDNAGGRSNIDRFQDTGANQLFSLQTVWTNPSISMGYGGTNLGNHLLMAMGREGYPAALNVLASTDSMNWTSVYSVNGTSSSDDHRGILTVHPERGGTAFTSLAAGFPASFRLGTGGTGATFTASPTGGVSPYSIQWRDSAGRFLGTGSTYTFTSTVNGTYVIYASVTDATQTSATSNTVTIVVGGTTATSHTVFFNPNGGTGTMSSQTTNVPAALSLGTFTRPGYTFIGWNTAPGGTGTSYGDGAVYSFAADLTLYAQWTPTVSGQGTFGDEAIEPSQSSVNNNRMSLLRVQVPLSGTITRLSVYTARLSGSPVLAGVVYADRNGVVGGLLGKGSEVAVTNALSAPTWVDLPGFSIPVSAGYVWIGVMVGPSTNSHAAAFWVNMSATSYTLDYDIALTYPGAPATPTGYSTATNVSWSIKGAF